MTEKVRIGIVGTSWWADMMHLPLLQQHPQLELIAICGRNRDRAEEMAQKYGIPKVFTDYRELIEKGNIQALVVATPDDLHYPITMAALDAGLHVLCEKPLALTVQQAREMTEKAESSGVKHMVNFSNRWRAGTQYLHQLIEEGYIGRCFHIHLFQLCGFGLRGRYAWRYDPQRALGILGDLGSHLIDLVRWYAGHICKVSAHLSMFIERPGPDGRPFDSANDSAMLMFQCTNGAQGVIHVSSVVHLPTHNMQWNYALYGEGGTLEMSWRLGEESVTFQGARRDEEPIRALTLPDHGFEESNVYSAFTEAIVEDRTLAPNFHDGLRVQEVIDAAIKADQQECAVSLQ